MSDDGLFEITVTIKGKHGTFSKSRMHSLTPAPARIAESEASYLASKKGRDAMRDYQAAALKAREGEAA